MKLISTSQADRIQLVISPASRNWSGLPYDILQLIAESLGITELLGFRGVCKHWRNASSTASALSDPSGKHPWLLIYGQDFAKCRLLPPGNRRAYSIEIPELYGSASIASNQGWILVHHRSSNSIFFLCPFSHARIDLPEFPEARTNFIAAFSSPPTNQDCVACIASNDGDSQLELHFIHRGDKAWTKHTMSGVKKDVSKIKGMAYNSRVFYMYEDDGYVSFAIENKKWEREKVVYVKGGKGKKREGAAIFSHYQESISHWTRNNLCAILGKEENKCIKVSTCGTCVREGEGEVILWNESLVDRKADDELEPREIKGVWINPRFYQIPADQTW